MIGGGVSSRDPMPRPPNNEDEPNLVEESEQQEAHRAELCEQIICTGCQQVRTECTCEKAAEDQPWVELQRLLNENEQELYGYKHGNKSLV